MNRKFSKFSWNNKKVDEINLRADLLSWSENQTEYFSKRTEVQGSVIQRVHSLQLLLGVGTKPKAMYLHFSRFFTEDMMNINVCLHVL